MSSLIKSLIFMSNMLKLKREFVDIPYSVLIQNCLNILLNEGYILGFHRKDSNHFRVFLKYYKGKSVISEIKLMSKPGFRRYIDIKSLFHRYSLSDLVVLSTPAGIVSNIDILNARSFSMQNKQNNFKMKNQVNLFNKQIKINSINHQLIFKLKTNKWNYFSFCNIFFHKNLILRSFFRKKGIISKLSKRQYFRNKNLRLFFKKYYSTFFLKKRLKLSNNFLSLSLKNLYFFKFKAYFTNYRYLQFKKVENFFKFVNKTNKIHFFSLFYFLFYIKQFSFSKYKYRFSLYLKYINHLLLFNNKNNLNAFFTINNFIYNNNNNNNNLNSINGGELLFIIR